jgi:hypothetical protein
LLSIAASAVVFILENAAVSRKAGSHPLPATRAFNILVDQMIQALFDYVEVSEDGRITFRNHEGIDIRAEFKRLARPSITHFLYDAKFIASYLGAVHLFLETDDRPMGKRPQTYEASVILSDLAAEFLGDAAPKPLESTGARGVEALAR